MPDLATYRERKSEADWQRQVTDLVDELGGEWQHTRDSRGERPHWPDLTIALPGGRTLYRELKVGNNPLTQGQAELLARLRKLGHDADVWRFPIDWPRAVAELGAQERVAPPVGVAAASVAPDSQARSGEILGPPTGAQILARYGPEVAALPEPMRTRVVAKLERERGGRHG